MTGPGSRGAGGSVSAAVRLHAWTERNLGRAVSVVQGVHDGLWLGAASRELLHAIDGDYYRHQGMYRDDGYNRSGLASWEAHVLDRFFAGRTRIAVTGAGAGREVLALLRRGHEPHGFECNAALVAAANRLLAAEAFDPLVSFVERDAWPAGTGDFDGVIVGWGSYMLMQGRARRVSFLRQARRHLAPRDPVLLSFFSRRGDRAYFRIVARVANSLRRAAGREPVELGDTLRPNYLHCFTEEEIRAELDDGGFEPLFYAEEPYAHAVGVAR